MMFSSIPGLRLIGASSTHHPPAATSKNICRLCQKSSAGQNHPSGEPMLLDEGITFSQKDNVYSLFMLCLILKKDLKKLQ